MPETAESPSGSPPPPSWWQRRLVHPIVQQLTQGITPDKIALTLAVGSALALFPIVGTTTLLCLLFGILLRLNQPIIQIVNGVCVPLHLPVILGLVRFGEHLYGRRHSALHIRFMSALLWDDPRAFFEKFGTIALHAVVAWAVLCPFWIAIVYLIARPVLRELDRMRTSAAVSGRPQIPSGGERKD